LKKIKRSPADDSITNISPAGNFFDLSEAENGKIFKQADFFKCPVG
jgi:hypothetical protein